MNTYRMRGLASHMLVSVITGAAVTAILLARSPGPASLLPAYTGGALPSTPIPSSGAVSQVFVVNSQARPVPVTGSLTISNAPLLADKSFGRFGSFMGSQEYAVTVNNITTTINVAMIQWSFFNSEAGCYQISLQGPNVEYLIRHPGACPMPGAYCYRSQNITLPQRIPVERVVLAGNPKAPCLYDFNIIGD